MAQMIREDVNHAGLHVALVARERYAFDPALYSARGNVAFPTFHAARKFAQKMNAQRNLLSQPERTVKAAQINALGLIDEILHFIVDTYVAEHAGVLDRAVAFVEARVGAEKLSAALRRYVALFPPLAVAHGQMTVEEYLAAEGGAHRAAMLHEVLALWVANMNPACAPYLELFDDAELEVSTAYPEIITATREFFASEPSLGPEAQALPDLLRTPAIRVPHSLTGQLEFILRHWASMLGKYLFRLLASLDFIKEEEKAIFPGPGIAQVYDYSGLEHEDERFSYDREWMVRLVMIAKNAYVWLDQLSKRYGRLITRLDEIPDEELDALRHRGFTGLWLIGLWERSRASQTIKQWCGNPDAVASAYSLFAYDAAGDLGGEAALDNLRERAMQRGIRLASDMVPNHMGIDSPWVIEHPDWFISLPYCPFPSYSFNGQSLSHDPRIGIYLEDHYFSRSDAAVVFMRVDHGTNDTRFIYHGNDGTSMPWNDTAQLNYLIPEVREAVIQTILHVARQFRIIRFDAAMTLAKKHYQRLWFPEPGTGGAIPSRAEHGMTRPEFHAVFPVEFWREVVDRVAAEVPDTLLLAEAFWLMEGYFVRTLGMHRVYNSAFMNMLRDEDNAKYRSVMKNTLEFDPEIMKRFVNFMNNPDERTAIDQFGKGDKYFGICVLMATLPGLPMFGHGQVEGFAEKYGMEYRRAYWDEHPDQDLVARHKREIFPLLHRRHIFAESANFQLYDFFTPEGHVNEDVFAYSNRCGDERGMVVYHNTYADTRGWVRMSVGFKEKGSGRIIQRALSDGLAVSPDGGRYLIFRDMATGLEYIRNCREVCDRGLYFELHAYHYHVFCDFREVQDNEWQHYAHLTGYLNGRGVPSIDAAMRELFLQPVHVAFKALVNPDLMRRVWEARVTTPGTEVPDALLVEVEGKLNELFTVAAQFTGGQGDIARISARAVEELRLMLRLPVLDDVYPALRAPEYDALRAYLREHLRDELPYWGTLFGWLFTHALGRVAGDEDFHMLSRSLFDEWLLRRILIGTLQELGQEYGAAEYAASTVSVLISHQDWSARELAAPRAAYQTLATWLNDDEVRRHLQVNRYQGVLFYNKEAFERLLWGMMLTAVWQAVDARVDDPVAHLAAAYGVIHALHQAESEAEYQVEVLLEVAKG